MADIQTLVTTEKGKEILLQLNSVGNTIIYNQLLKHLAEYSITLASGGSKRLALKSNSMNFGTIISMPGPGIQRAL